MGKFTEFNLPLKSLAQGTHQFEYHLGETFFTNMENTDIHGADLTVILTVNHNADRYDLTFCIKGEVILLCDRCLDDLHYPIDASYRMTVEYGDDYNADSDEILIIPDSDNYLNVAYMIYDTVVLAIPMKHVHPMGKCNRQMSAILRKHRATPASGEDGVLEEELIESIDEMESDDTPTDPRWDALKGLASDNDD